MLIVSLIVMILLIVGIPIGCSFLLYRFIKRKNYNRRLRIIAFAPVLIIGYLLYSAVFPSENFYRQDFKEVTGQDLPESVEFRYKSATYPDHFGDYASFSIIKVGKVFYMNLPQALLKKGYTEKGEKVHSKEFDKALKNLGKLQIEKEFTLHEPQGKYYYVGFLTDQESIMVQRLSW